MWESVDYFEILKRGSSHQKRLDFDLDVRIGENEEMSPTPSRLSLLNFGILHQGT